MKSKVQQVCFCCGKGHFIKFFSDTYRCNNCNHIYRDYKKSAADFHADGGDYRKKEYDQTSRAFNSFAMKDEPDRLRKVRNQISHFKKYVNKNQTALEVASGKGFMLRELKGMFKHITASDIHPLVCEHNKIYNPHVDDFIVSDVLELSTSKKYDVVIAMDMLEHVEDVDKFVEKMHAIAKEKVVIQVPTERSLRRVNPDFDGHVHYFSKKSLKSLFQKRGLFKCVHLHKSERGELANGREIIAVFERNPHE